MALPVDKRVMCCRGQGFPHWAGVGYGTAEERQGWRTRRAEEIGSKELEAGGAPALQDASESLRTGDADADAGAGVDDAIDKFSLMRVFRMV